MGICALFGKRFPRMCTEQNFSFSDHTTVGCGGTAALAIAPESTEETAQVLAFLQDEYIPYCFLGAGANVLPADGFWDGVVVLFRKLRNLQAEGNTITAGAGVTGGELLRFAKTNRLGGFEPFAGIPMTVGGGAAMNAGIKAKHFSDLVVSVTGIERGKIHIFTANECGYSEKNSVFLEKNIAVTEVRFRGEPSEKISENTKYYLEARRNLPKGKSMGCTFVNPEGKSAGEIIDKCGLKGRSVGKARVSEIHANFIINEGNSSQDIARLISIVKNEVHRQTGITLREEIRRIP